MLRQNKYRTHTSATLSNSDVGKKVRAAGWVENIRDHGGVMFLDIRDHYGTLQAVVKDEALLANVRRECALSVFGEIVKRDEETFNPKINTGEIEIMVEELSVLGQVRENLPFEPALSKETNEETRLKYRFLDLRNKAVHDTIVMRSELIAFMREQMNAMSFLEMQTPILTASSPEGARDFLVPSRKHRGKFYALPQAPQIFKQLLMVSGFDRYYQIAPCFRDEDARADRTAGEFYQLDMEMAFAEQDDVLEAGERLISAVIQKFGKNKQDLKFPRITFEEALLKYGTDKPDLRNPLFIIDLSDLFVNSEFKPFANKTVRAIRVPQMASKSKTFFKKMEEFAFSIGMKGLGYIEVEDSAYVGPIDKFLTDEARKAIRTRAELQTGDVLYFIADNAKNATKYAGQIRAEVAERMELIDANAFAACWITDFPFYEEDEKGKPRFGHNPFSMPQGELKALNEGNPFEIKAHQYDFVLNGVELASGAVRNHDVDVMVKAFEIAGFTQDDVKSKFGALYSAFKFGAPPHAGMAFGVDRLLMILKGEENVREVIAFPLNSAAQDALLNAPSEVGEAQLREIHVKVR